MSKKDGKCKGFREENDTVYRSVQKERVYGGKSKIVLNPNRYDQ